MIPVVRNLIHSFVEPAELKFAVNIEVKPKVGQKVVIFAIIM